MVLQLFVRDNIPADFGENVYMVCGLIKSETPLSDESIHLFAGQLNDIESRDVSEVSRGNNLDGIIQRPLWKKFK